MRRTTMIFSAALVLLVLGPASALARHHSRHHSRAHHARILRFGDTSTSSTSSNSADNAGTVAGFTGDVLTINTSDGPIRGHVNDQTECMAPSSQTMHTDGDNGGGGGGDQSGSGDHSGSGDDQGQDQNDVNEANETEANGSNENQAEDQNEANEDQNEADDNDANQNEANEDQGEDAAMSCTPATVPVNTVVREAVLRTSGAGNVWVKVEFGS